LESFVVCASCCLNPPWGNWTCSWPCWYFTFNEDYD
jgi:hypothetical protein